jgi:hypothetical protein
MNIDVVWVPAEGGQTGKRGARGCVKVHGNLRNEFFKKPGVWMTSEDKARALERQCSCAKPPG